jgi:hypothetical protein
MATKTLEKHEEKHETTVEKESVKDREGREIPEKEVAPPPMISGFAFDDLTIDPDAIQGSRHAGPLLSGAPEDGSAGIAMLHKRAKLTVANGNFTGAVGPGGSLPFRFPASTILTTAVVQVQTAYNGTTPFVNVGTTPGGTNVLNQALGVQGQFFTNINAILPSDWTLYLSQVLGASTAGKCTVLISYSVPAKTIAS